MTFNTGNTKGTDHCIIGNIHTPSDINNVWSNLLCLLQTEKDFLSYKYNNGFRNT